jgi:hypothetical protein
VSTETGQRALGRLEIMRSMERGRAVRWSARCLALAVIVLGSSCRSSAPPAPKGPSPLPPVPSLPSQSLGPSQPPLIWVGGTLTSVTSNRLEITEPFGSVVRLARLGDGTTVFFEVQAGAWRRLAATTPIETGAEVCAQTLLDGTNLLALRVFLGAGCGPA